MTHSRQNTPSERDHASDVVARIRHIIDRNAVAPVYQPLLHLNTGNVIGYEALTRVEASYGFASTADLFDAAVSAGALWDLEAFTRARSLQETGPWPEGRLLFLNCNPEVAADSRFAAEFLSILREQSEIPPSRIVLEITERAETQYMKGLTQQVQRLREAGVQIAIDDMGAGTSGLQRIMDLRPDWLKLDRDLIADIDRDPFKQNLIDVLLRFTRVSGARLVAEGVERREQISVLLDLGVQYVQGYLIARPATEICQPDDTILEWISEEVDRVESSRVTQHLTFLAGIARDAPALDSSVSLETVRDALQRQPEAPGVVALRDGGCTGWVERDALQAPDAFDDGLTLGDIGRNAGPPAPPTTLVSEALLFLSTRQHQSPTDPIIIDRENGSWGVVTIGALLREAARLTAIADSSYAEVSGLPGRVKTDQRLSSFLRRKAAGSVLYIDIRDFHRINEDLGFDLGDLMLRILAGVLISVVEDATASDEGFAGHLGDDRFLVVLDSPGAMRVADKIIREFESSSDRFVSCARAGENAEKALAAGLRIVCLDVAPSTYATSRDLHNAAWSARMLHASESVGRSTIHRSPALSLASGDHRRRSA